MSAENIIDDPTKGSTQDSDAARNPWEVLSVTGIEADIAYFEARLELIGTPSTLNQQAQQRTFRILTQNLTRILHRLLGKAARASWE